MTKLTFTTTGAWDAAYNFGCASLGLAGICDNGSSHIVQYPLELEGIVLTGSYEQILRKLPKISDRVYAAVVLFGNAGGENDFIRKLHRCISCPMVGGGAAIDGLTGRSALITGGGEAAVFLITDDRYTYETDAKCIHNKVLDSCRLELKDPRTILRINGVDAGEYLSQKRQELGLSATDFEHLTLSDFNNVNAHLSSVDGVIKSGRDLHENMILSSVDHEKVYEVMDDFYNDPSAIIFGCAGLAGLLDRPLNTKSLGLFLFGEVCTMNGMPEFGNLMLSKLKITQK